MERREISEIVSYSKDGNTMHVDVQRATDSYLRFLLYTLGGSDSFYRIRYVAPQGDEFTLESEKILIDDPEKDNAFITDKVQELNKAWRLEIEKILAVPQTMIPAVEYYL